MKLKTEKDDLMFVYKNVDFEELLKSYFSKLEDLRRCL